MKKQVTGARKRLRTEGASDRSGAAEQSVEDKND